jgi:hypothetical protein
VLQVPIHPNLELEDVRRICRIVNGVLGESTSTIDAMTKPLEVPENSHVVMSSGKVSGGSR